MAEAYKHADGKKIDGRRVVVDCERGRTMKGWFPRRLGGGLGGTRRGGPEVNIKSSGRDESRGEDRYFRERERIERRRSRSRSRERRHRSRSRSRDRHHERHRRERSRGREKTRDRDTSSVAEKVGNMDNGTDGVNESESRKDRRRSKSRDRDRRRRRSRSRDRKHRDRDERNTESRLEQDHTLDQDMRVNEQLPQFA